MDDVRLCFYIVLNVQLTKIYIFVLEHDEIPANFCGKHWNSCDSGFSIMKSESYFLHDIQTTKFKIINFYRFDVDFFNITHFIFCKEYVKK